MKVVLVLVGINIPFTANLAEAIYHGSSCLGDISESEPYFRYGYMVPQISV